MSQSCSIKRTDDRSYNANRKRLRQKDGFQKRSKSHQSTSPANIDHCSSWNENHINMVVVTIGRKICKLLISSSQDQGPMSIFFHFTRQPSDYRTISEMLSNLHGPLKINFKSSEINCHLQNFWNITWDMLTWPTASVLNPLKVRFLYLRYFFLRWSITFKLLPSLFRKWGYCQMRGREAEKRKYIKYKIK